MKFRLEEIPREGRKEKYSREQSWLDGRLGGETGESFRFTSPMTVSLELTRSGGMALLKSRVDTIVEWRCARCLEPFSAVLHSEAATSFKPKPASFPEEIELTREDAETEFYEGEEIDATQVVQDQVLLALPAKAVCREDCRGLCPRCGINLNREVCRCESETVDPRLAVLKKFRAR
jgi:uncharacterized protein